MKQRWGTIVIAVVLIVILLGSTVFKQVPARHHGVIKTFGQFGAPRTSPGLLLKAPWPIQSLRNISMMERTRIVKASQMTTEDEKAILMELALTWRVQDALAYARSFGDKESAEAALETRALNARQEVPVRLEKLVSTATGQESYYADYRARLLKELRAALAPSNYGIEVVDIRITRLAYPEKNTAAVHDRMIQERKRLSEKILAEGDQEAKIILNNANRMRDTLLADGEAEAIRIRAEGEAKATEYYGAFKDAPELANFLRRLEATKTILSDRATVVLPAKSLLRGLYDGDALAAPAKPAASRAEEAAE